MQSWKKAVVFGSIGVGAVLFFRGQRGPALASAAVGLAVLASEYPDTFEDLWENAPQYVNRGVTIFHTLQQVAERFAEQAADQAGEAFDDMRDVARNQGY